GGTGDRRIRRAPAGVVRGGGDHLRAPAVSGRGVGRDRRRRPDRHWGRAVRSAQRSSGRRPGAEPARRPPRRGRGPGRIGPAPPADRARTPIELTNVTRRGAIAGDVAWGSDGGRGDGRNVILFARQASGPT